MLMLVKRSSTRITLDSFIQKLGVLKFVREIRLIHWFIIIRIILVSIAISKILSLSSESASIHHDPYLLYYLH